MDKLTELNALEMHALVWQVRHELEAEGSKWKTPARIDALRYMRGELCELADLEMRQRLDDARNNARVDSMDDEAADVLMMAFTAAGEDAISEFSTLVYYSTTTGDRAKLIDVALSNVSSGIVAYWKEYGMGCCWAVAAGQIVSACPNALSRIPHRLARIVRKHGVVPHKDSVNDDYAQKWQAILGDAYST